MRAPMNCLILALVLLAGSAARADVESCLSGFEVSAGHTVGDTTTGVTFAGTDSPGDTAACEWTTDSQGGVWYASINRVGQAGLGGAVDVTGGRWLWDRANSALFRGRVIGGSVTWPNSLKPEDDLGCGPGIAQFSVTLTVVGHPQGGSFVGCLDDTHLNPFQQPFVFPPHIWGVLKILG